jgi:hypothetical protein
MISLNKLLDIVATEAIEGKTVNPRFGKEPEVIYHQPVSNLNYDESTTPKAYLDHN